jgi:hypothetical protein
MAAPTMRGRADGDRIFIDYSVRLLDAILIGSDEQRLLRLGVAGSYKDSRAQRHQGVLGGLAVEFSALGQRESRLNDSVRNAWTQLST